jgi:hypothetical protein
MTQVYAGSLPHRSHSRSSTTFVPMIVRLAVDSGGRCGTVPDGVRRYDARVTRVSGRRSALGRLAGWPRIRWIAAGTCFVVLIGLTGVQTALIPNPWSTRMIPPGPWMWPVLLASGGLAALLLASYLDTSTARGGWLGAPGGFLALLSVSCPSCNVLAVLLLGPAGAVRWWAPLQPAVAAVGLSLLGYALRTRLLIEVGEPASTVPPGPLPVSPPRPAPAPGPGPRPGPGLR